MTFYAMERSNEKAHGGLACSCAVRPPLLLFRLLQCIVLFPFSGLLKDT